MAKWLAARWAVFFPALQQLTTEAEVKALCEAEIQAWRERPEIKNESTLRNPMTSTRKEIETRLTGDVQAWALAHMAFSRGWYIKHNAPSQDNLSTRLENQQLLKDPDAIVAKGDALLDSDYWPDVVVGLLVCTGRRPGEIFATGSFEQKTEYSVKFSGQLKRRGDPLPAYEIPTLCKASRVIDALARVRTKMELNVANMDTAAITRKYSPLVKEAANRHFADLIPARPSASTKKTGPADEGLYGQLFRAVYPRIAVFWYCPPTIDDRHFMATIQGHRKHFEELETEEERLSYSSGAHYSDYKIADAQGNIDGRQGLRLGAKGVELLEVFKPKSRRKEPMTATTDQAQEQTQAQTKPEGKNVPVTVDRPTFNRVQALRTGKNHRTYSETLNLLLDIYEQGGQPLNTGELTPERIVPAGAMIRLSPEKSVLAVDMIREALEDGEDFSAFLLSALTKEAKFREGLDRRHEGKNFEAMTLTQLVKTRDPRATNERIRRAVAAIAAYNDEEARADTERWFLNATTIHRLVGGRYPIITKYIEDHQVEIDALNAKYDLNERYNSKPYKVEAKITVPDESPAATPEPAQEAAGESE